MKILFLQCSVALLLSSVFCQNCEFKEEEDKTICSKIYLKKDDPLNLTFYGLKFKMNEANGSIHLDTFLLLPDVEDLELTYSDINHIDASSFSALPNLQRLTISQSRSFPNMTKNILQGCRKLKELKLLSNDQLYFSEHCFKNLDQLEKLTITGYRFELNWNVFEGLSNLKSLSLQSNSIVSVDVGRLLISLPKLEEFDINYNPIPCGERKNIFTKLEQRGIRVLDEFKSDMCNWVFYKTFERKPGSRAR